MIDQINERMQAILQAESDQRVYDVLTSTADELFDTPSLIVVADDHGTLNPVASTLSTAGLQGNNGVESLPSIDVDSPSVLSETYTTGHVRECDLNGDEPGLGSVQGEAVVAIPLGSHGVWALTRAERGPIDDHQTDLLKLLGTSAEHALDRLSETGTLQSRVDDSDRTVDKFDQLTRALETVLEIEHLAREADTRETLERDVCEELAGLDHVAMAWVGALNDGQITPRAVAGIGEAYLGEVDLSVTSGSDEPSVVAVRTKRRTMVEDIADNIHEEAWHREALVGGFQSAVSVPLIVDEQVYGVLSVFGSMPSAFDELWGWVLEDVADALGARTAAIESERALYADSVIELELELTDGDDPFSRVARAVGGTVTFENVTKSGDVHLLFAVPDADTDAVERALDARHSVESVTHLPVDDAGLFEVTVGEQLPPLLAVCTQQGAIIRSITAGERSTRLVVDLGIGADVSAFVRGLETAYDVTLLSRRNRSQPAETRRTFLAALCERLTPRQFEVLHTAYMAGYFEWPRESTGEEVAALLDITQPTFNRHLRTAERKLFEELYED